VLWAISPDRKQELITWANKTIITKEMVENLIDAICWPEHAIPCIIIQPGSSKMEKLCPGLLYMFLSHGTTIGLPNCRARSSILFISDELTRDRIQNLITTKTEEQCVKISC
jgi:hypothetical protein